jgi:putative transposase
METKRLIPECCEHQGIALLARKPDQDPMHVFVCAPPRFRLASIARLLKGDSSQYWRETFPQPTKLCGREHLWTQAYSVGPAGNVSAAVIRRSIEASQDQ